VVVSVRDTGIGIAPEFLPRVFERFSQESSSARYQSGLGLGLSIVKQLVEMHGGSIAATSEGPGMGAAFTVTLPRAGPAAYPPAHSRP
jgi:signal transduction histidine kinase